MKALSVLEEKEIGGIMTSKISWEEHIQRMIARNKANATHGMTNTPEYAAWRDIKRRCYSPDFKQYHDYGGRGIIMCPTWVNSFQNFYRDMGARPIGCSIDRKDNEGNYTPNNCQWATKQQQAHNRRDSRFITYNGFTKTLTQWMKELNNPQIANRLHRGWTIERALSTPINKRNCYAA